MIEKKCIVCNKMFNCFSYASERRKTCSKDCKINYLKYDYLCVGCGETNPEKFYGASKSNCKSCHNKNLMVKRQNLLKTARELLGNKCSICGYNKCSNALEFHHTTEEKEFNIAGARFGWNKLKEEIKKCILLCANCHREHHQII